MYSYIIDGGNRLVGETYVSGSKNASLPILAATIISGKISKLYNVPDIEDVNITLKILESLGCKIRRTKEFVLVDSSKIDNTAIPDELMRKLRSSVVIVGALIARFKSAYFSYPGGCDIGSRPIDLHLKNFEKIGIKITQNSRYIECKCDKIESKKIHLDFPSVGATENIILSSVKGNQEIIINNAAREPEIIDLANFLNKMGAKIYGAGSSIIRVNGVNELKNVTYRIMSDRIEAGTLLVAGAITKGNITVKNINPNHLEPIISKLIECGCDINTNNNLITIDAKKRLKSTQIITMPYPGFPTDMQPIFSTFLTVCKRNFDSNRKYI